MLVVGLQEPKRWMRFHDAFSMEADKLFNVIAGIADDPVSFRALLSAPPRSPEAQPDRECRMSDIFISYSREDRPRAKLIAEELERRGWSVWWDRIIPAGQVFDDVIEQAIRDAKCIIVLWSSHSVGSRWVRSEASEGADRQILVPVLIEEVPIPLAFKRIQAADLTMWRDGVMPASFEKLVSDINALPGLARPGENDIAAGGAHGIDAEDHLLEVAFEVDPERWR